MICVVKGSKQARVIMFCSQYNKEGGACGERGV